MRKFLLATATAGALLIAAQGANALTTTSTFTVNATVLKNCSVLSSNLAFGNYTPGGGNIDSTSTVTVKCTKNTPYTVALDKGTTTGGTIAQRLMVNGANTLQYNLFTDTTRTTLWGDGTTGTAAAGTGAGFATTTALTVYGRLPDNATNQNAAIGTYADTVTVTVTY
jgi:spore coat protein U-like protein